MQSLIGTGSYEGQETIGSGFHPSSPQNQTLDHNTLKKLGDKLKVDGVDDMQREIVSMRQEVHKLSRIVTPLMAITDLSIKQNMIKTMKEKGEEQKLDDEEMLTNVAGLRIEDKIKELENVNPILVLNNLAQFVNTRELTT